MTCVIKKEATRRCGGGPKSAYNYEEGGGMKEMETRRSLGRRKRCLRWKLSVPRVGPIAGPLTLTKTAFIKALASTAHAASLEPCQGHGICIGTTLEYLLRGVPFEVMKVKGCWASDAFLIYLTKHAQILAPYMQAHPVLHNEFIKITMPQIQHHCQ